MKILEKTEMVTKYILHMSYDEDGDGSEHTTRKEAEEMGIRLKLLKLGIAGTAITKLLRERKEVVEILTLFDKEPEDTEAREELDSYLANAPDPGEGYRLLERGETIKTGDEILDCCEWRETSLTLHQVWNAYFRRKVEE